MSWALDIINSIEDSAKYKNHKGLKICTVKSINPLILTYNTVDIGTVEGDTIFVHPLMISSLIDLDENAFLKSQNFKSSTAYNSPTFEAIIEGSIVKFINDFYKFYQNWQNIFKLNVGDMVVVYELEGNSFLILQKVIKDFIDKNEVK